MNRRAALRVLGIALLPAGCVGSPEERIAEAASAYNSGVALYESAAETFAAARDAYERGAWAEAESAFNRARSGYSRAADRFDEVRTEASGCPALVEKAGEWFARCSDMVRAAARLLQAASQRRAGDAATAARFRRRAEAAIEAADAHGTPGRVDPENPAC